MIKQNTLQCPPTYIKDPPTLNKKENPEYLLVVFYGATDYHIIGTLRRLVMIFVTVVILITNI